MAEKTSKRRIYRKIERILSKNRKKYLEITDGLAVPFFELKLKKDIISKTMISYLSGKIIFKKEKFIILDVNGVGYKVFLSKKNISKLPEIGKELKVFCFLNVRENILDIYGFLSFDELEFFEILESIRGVGPKASLEISSLGSLEKIRERILAQDDKIFEGIPGIGKKRAMTIILELSGKIRNISEKKLSESDEAEDTLVNLGFSRLKAKEALKSVSKEKNTEERIKQALKILGQN